MRPYKSDCIKPFGVISGKVGVLMIKKPLKGFFHSLLSVAGWLKLKTLQQPTLVILTYHRILPMDSKFRHQEQPGMIASPDTLQCHLSLFRSLGASFVDLEDWLNRKSAGAQLPKLAVAITFDDGWRDNYTYAFPILKAFEAPATIFLVSKYLDTHRVFWPEQVIRYVTIEPQQRPQAIHEWLRNYAGSLPFDDRPLTIEEADVLIDNLKTLDDQTILEQLERSTVSEEEPVRQILNSEELIEMHGSGLVRFGAHTRQHFRLNRLTDPLALRNEIVLCKDDLEALGVGTISLFCYPNGDITNQGERFVAEAYLGACTTKNGINSADTSPYNLKRFNFHDGNGKSRRLCFSTIGRSLIFA